jgi:predicted porin
MKKQLIAAAVASAFAVPAMAQNVTISGYFEASMASTNYNIATQADSTAMDQGILGSSRWAINASEDLGGGLKAGLRLESSLGVSGTVSGGAGSSGDGPDVLFNRGAELNLSGAFGMVRLGKFDHQGGENTDIVASFTGNIGLSAGASTNSNNDGPEGVEMGSDRDGTIAYRTPTFAGGYVEVAHTTDDQITAALSGNAGATVQGALSSVYYQGTLGGVNVRAGYAKQDAKTAAAETHTASRYGIGFHYNFGVVEAGVSYAKLTTNTNTENKELLVGIKAPLGNGLDIRATYQDYDQAGSTTTASDYKELTVALVKTLSKRTNAYIGYTDWNGGVGALTTSQDKAIMRVGMSHSF